MNQAATRAAPWVFPVALALLATVTGLSLTDSIIALTSSV
jgi:hypothetical protein